MKHPQEPRESSSSDTTEKQLFRSEPTLPIGNIEKPTVFPFDKLLKGFSGKQPDTQDLGYSPRRDPKIEEELEFGKIDDQPDQQKTQIFLHSGWNPTSEKSIVDTLQMKEIDQPDENLFFVVAEAPNVNKKSVEFSWFSQFVQKEDIQTVVFPKFSAEDQVPIPQYMFYTLRHGKFQECADPRTATPPPQELAA